MRGGGEISLQQGDPLPHADQTESRFGGEARAPAAVGDLDGERLGAVHDRHPAGTGRGVTDHIGHRLLDDAERRQVDVRRQRPGLAPQVYVDPDPGGGR